MANRQKLQKHRQSLFLDKVLSEFSLVSSLCDLYIPQPSLRFNEAGVIEDICEDQESQGFCKQCRVHLCLISDVSPDFMNISQEDGDENKIYLSVILNKINTDELTSQKKTDGSFEFKKKDGNKFRKFLLKFEDKKTSHEFTTSLENHIQELKLVEEKSCTYLLLAVPPSTTRTSILLSKNRTPSTGDYTNIETDSRYSSVKREENLQNKPVVDQTGFSSITPPFDPAPYSPAAYYGIPPQFNSLQENEIDKTNERTHSDSSFSDSLKIHTSELPQSLRGVLDSINRADSGEGGANLSLKDSGVGESKEDNKDEVLNSEFLPTEKLYIPMGVQNNNSMEEKYAPLNQKMTESEKLAKQLETAINNKDTSFAEEWAKKLTLQDVNVSIIVHPKSHTTEDKQKEFSLKVNIEDKEISGASIILKVKSTDTIRDLKNRMLIKHGFPVEVQNWIIGQRIPTDNQTLAQCRIKTDGHSVYLYLVSAKSVGLSKEDSLHRYPSGQLGLIDRSTIQELPALTRTGSTPATSGSQSGGSRPASMATPGSAASARVGAGAAGMTPASLQNVLDPNINKMQEKKQILANKLPTPNIQDDRPVQVVMATQQEGLTMARPNIPAIPIPGSRTPTEHNETNGWACSACTFINQPTRPGCEVCSNPRPEDYVIPETYVISEEEQQRLEYERMLELQTQQAEERQRNEQLVQRAQNYQYLQETDAQDTIPNTEPFTCPICFDDYGIGEGVVLRECLHTFCRDCLSDAVTYNEEPELKCPFQDDNYACDGVLQDREIKAVCTKEQYDKYLARSLTTAESQAANSFHCKSNDCPGWCIYEDHVNFFVCPVCRKENCLTCKAIHQDMNCKQYQEDLKIRARNDGAANQTQIMINMMLRDGDAMKCPQCQVIVMKKEGCDWVQCSICKTEICWVTKGPRWGPLGNGDITGGCRCRVNGQMCHPECNNCH